MAETSIVRENLMKREGYAPYCGNNISRDELNGCDNPRMKFDGDQFVCPKCKLRTVYPKEFIENYKKKWSL